MKMNTTPSPFAVVRIDGADAETFLQGQLTQDVRKVGATPLPAGYCSPKGRLLALMTLSRDANGFLMRIHRSVLEATLKRLRMFVLRSKVTFEVLDPGDAGDDSASRLADILAGRPVIYPQTADQFVPQMVNLDQLGGISLEKGCYTGQEIVARLHYLGQLKRRMFLCRSHAAQALVEPGTPVHAQDETQAVGMVVDCAAEADGRLALSVVLQLNHSQSRQLYLLSPDQALTVPQAYS